ncbi:MAG: molybdopterin molybdenumtransferase MoeA [Candidatus Helarchaeota archaeon]|nr:molybdopterin molybdenumtransferase MoeA [Candidatus Helarchaeota archaeon]
MTKFYQTLSAEEVKNILNEKLIFHIQIEEIKVENALGRILAKDIISFIDVPGFSKSRMDGYAVKAKDTFGAEEDTPINLKKIGEIRAGEIFNKVLNEKECIQIATGAPIPDGANAVVMVEYTEEENEIVKIYKSATPQQYIIQIGADIKKGEIVLKEEKQLNTRDLGLISALGITKITVYSKPKVTIFSTGDELVPPGEPLTSGKIYDINLTTIYNAVKESGGISLIKGIIKDDYETLNRIISKEISKIDFLIISGGTSKGIGDYLPDVIKNLKDLDFYIHGIRIKPGKPTLLSAIKDGNLVKPIIVLPGYPTSALTIFYHFIAPLIRKWAHLPQPKEKIMNAIAEKRIYSELGRRELRPVKITEKDDKIFAKPIHTGSEAISTLALTDGYIDIPEQVQLIEEGEKIVVYLFS